MKRKWKGNKGETLVEVLASILIGALSVALLFGAVLASVNMDRTAKAADKVYGESLKAAERRTADDDHPVVNNKEVKITVKEEAGGVTPSGAEVKVNFYGGKGAWSFALSP